MRVCLFAYQMYNPGKHSPLFIKDVISFTHTFLEHLEEFSKGRMLMIKTGKRRKVKKNKRQMAAMQTQDNNLSGDENDDDISDKEEGAAKEKDAEFDPEKPDNLSDDEANGAIEDTFHDAEMDEESD